MGPSINCSIRSKKISKEIEQYIHHSRSRILQQLALLLKSTTSAIRREYPTDQQPGTLKPRNWFQGKPPLVTVKYEPQSIVKSLVLSDWLLLFPAGVLSVEEQSFYEVLIRSGYRLMAWDGRRCVDIKKNNEVIDYHTLYERLENINFIPGNSTELKPHLSRLIDLNQFVLADFSWCQKQLVDLFQKQCDFQTYWTHLSQSPRKSKLKKYFISGLGDDFTQLCLAKDHFKADDFDDGFVEKISQLTVIWLKIHDKECIVKLIAHARQLKNLSLTLDSEAALQQLGESLVESKLELESLNLELINIRDAKSLTALPIKRLLGDLRIISTEKSALDLSLFKDHVFSKLSVFQLSNAKIDFNQWPENSFPRLKELRLQHCEISKVDCSKIMYILCANNLLTTLHVDQRQVYHTFYYYDHEKKGFVSPINYYDLFPNIRSEASQSQPHTSQLLTESEISSHHSQLRTILNMIEPDATAEAIFGLTRLNFDSHTGLDEQEQKILCWYITPDADDPFIPSDNHCEVFNCIGYYRGKWGFGTRIDGTKLLTDITLEKFTLLDADFLQTVATNWRKLHSEAKTASASKPKSRFYLAEVPADFTGTKAGNLGKGWMLLPARSLYEKMLYFSVSDPSMESKIEIFRALPTYQIVVKLNSHIKPESVATLKFRYLCVSLPPCTLSIPNQYFTNQSDDETLEMMSRLGAALAMPKSALGQRYPNAVNYWKSASSLKPDQHLPIAMKTLMYCSDYKQDSSRSIQGFTVADLKHIDDFSAFLNYPVSSEMQAALNVMLQQLGACRHRAFTFILWCVAFKIPWLLTKSEIHAWPTVLFPTREQDAYTSLSFMKLGGAPAKYQLIPSPLESHPTYRARQATVGRAGGQTTVMAVESKHSLQYRSFTQQMMSDFKPTTFWPYTCTNLDQFCQSLLQYPRPLVIYDDDSMVLALMLVMANYLRQHNPGVHFELVRSPEELLRLLNINVITEKGEYQYEHPGILRQAMAKKQPIILLIDWTDIQNKTRFHCILDTEPKLERWVLPTSLQQFQVISFHQGNDLEPDFLGRCESIPFPKKLRKLLAEAEKETDFTRLSQRLSDEKTPKDAIVLPLENDPYWRSRIDSQISIDPSGKLKLSPSPILTAVTEGKPLILQNVPLGDARFDYFWVKILIQQRIDYNGRSYPTKLSSIPTTTETPDSKLILAKEEEEKKATTSTEHEDSTPLLQLKVQQVSRSRPSWLPLLNNSKEIEKWLNGAKYEIGILNSETVTDFMPTIMVKNDEVAEVPCLLDAKHKDDPHLLIWITKLLTEEEWQRWFGVLEKMYPETQPIRSVALSIQPPAELYCAATSGDIYSFNRRLISSFMPKKISSTATVMELSEDKTASRKEQKQLAEKKINTKHRIIESNQPLSTLAFLQHCKQVSSDSQVEMSPDSQVGVSPDSQVVFLNRAMNGSVVIEDYSMTQTIGAMPQFSHIMRGVGRDLTQGRDVVLVATSAEALDPSLYYQLEPLILNNYLWLNGERVSITGRLTLIVARQGSKPNALFSRCGAWQHQVSFADYQPWLSKYQSGSNWERLALFNRLTHPELKLSTRSIDSSITTQQYYPEFSFIWCMKLMQRIPAGTWEPIARLLNAVEQATPTTDSAFRQVLAKLLFCVKDDHADDECIEQEIPEIKSRKSSAEEKIAILEMPAPSELWPLLNSHPPETLLQIFNISSWQEVYDCFDWSQGRHIPRLKNDYWNLYQIWQQSRESKKSSSEAKEIKKIKHLKPDDNHHLSCIIDTLITQNEPVCSLIGPPGVGKSFIIMVFKQYLEDQGHPVLIYLGIRSIPIFLKDAQKNDRCYRLLQLDEINMEISEVNMLFTGLYQQPKPGLWQSQEFFPLPNQFNKVILTGNFINFPGRFPLPDFIDTIIFSTPSHQFLIEKIIYPNLPADMLEDSRDIVASIILAGYEWLRENVLHLDFSPRNIHDVLSLLNLLLSQQKHTIDLQSLKQLTVIACYRRFSAFIPEHAVTESESQSSVTPGSRRELEVVLRQAAKLPIDESLSFEPIAFEHEEKLLTLRNLSLPPTARRVVRQILETLMLRRRVIEGWDSGGPSALIIETKPGWGKSTLIKVCCEVVGLVNGNSDKAASVPPTNLFFMLNMQDDIEEILFKIAAFGGIALIDEYNTMPLPLEKTINLILDLTKIGKKQSKYAVIEGRRTEEKKPLVSSSFLLLATQNSTQLKHRKRISNASINRSYYLNQLEFDKKDLIVIAQKDKDDYAELWVACFEVYKNIQIRLRKPVSDLRDFRKMLAYSSITEEKKSSIEEKSTLATIISGLFAKKLTPDINSTASVVELKREFENIMLALINVGGKDLSAKTQTDILKEILSNKMVEKICIDFLMERSKRDEQDVGFLPSARREGAGMFTRVCS